MELVRVLVGKPIFVSSGYRSPAVNRIVGGASNGAHVLGLAADIHCSGVTPKQLANAIKVSGIAFDQLIYEGTWVHIGLSDGTPRQQVLTAVFDNGRASYLVGIA
ncbi:D-Ala-D-Ala carboxypeptidase family metallohydrolase [Collimonas sp. H4R21]|uniref:D-Ala-D-Ala carboxypeptidase family metallohydrolase n=1 Tax=Collimonas rhizosphaerae TaxID=3126357 RepID=A0ABU9PQC2_9BURK